MEIAKRSCKTILMVLILWGCSSSISLFSEQAYQQAISLKIESLSLMDKATESYDVHQNEVIELKKQLDKSHEYAKGRPKNEITTRQWEILTDSSRNLLGGFLKRWKDSNTLSSTFIRESKGLVSDGFDTIIGLESGKIKPSDME